MSIIDCHSHFGTPGHGVLRTDEDWRHAESVFRTSRIELSDAEQAAYFRSHGASAIFDLSYTKDLPLEDMQRHHDYAIDYQRSYPDVVFGHWLQFQPSRAIEGVREYERVRAAAGSTFVGFCINGPSTGVPAADAAWDPIYKHAIDVKLPVMILCGLTGIGQGHPGGKGIVIDDGHPRHIDRVAARFPELRILAARPGFPWQDEMIAILRHKANVCYELHGWGPRQFSPGLKKEISSRLQDRVMFGCDFPGLRFEKVIPDWLAEPYSPELLNKVLYENASRYFQVGAT